MSDNALKDLIEFCFERGSLRAHKRFGLLYHEAMAEQGRYLYDIQKCKKELVEGNKLMEELKGEK